MNSSERVYTTTFLAYRWHKHGTTWT